MTDFTQLSRLLVTLGRQGIELAIDPRKPDRLLYRPINALESTIGQIRLQNTALRCLLSTPLVPSGPDSEHTLNERLGIADDLGLSTHPGSPGWLTAVGESIKINCSTTSIEIHSYCAQPCELNPSGDRSKRPDSISDREGVGSDAIPTLKTG